MDIFMDLPYTMKEGRAIFSRLKPWGFPPAMGSKVCERGAADGSAGD